MREQRLTAGEIRGFLKRCFPAPESAVVFEVAQATGFSANRRLDAVIMDLWPSRGLSLHGVEIKVDLYDWRREKANPEKAEEIARFCDFFSIAAPAGLIPLEEIPAAWGLMEFGADGGLSHAKRAQKTTAEPVGRAFLAAMMRAATRPADQDTLDAAMAAERRRLEQGFKEQVQIEVERRQRDANQAAANWQRLMKEIGDAGDRWLSDHKVITAVRAVFRSGLADDFTGIKALHVQMRGLLEGIESQAAAFGIDLPERRTKKTRRARAA